MKTVIRLIVLCAVLTATSLPAFAAEPAVGEKFLVVTTREWTYELTLHGRLGVHFDPYLVNSVLLGSNVTHGSRPAHGQPAENTLTMRAASTADQDGQLLELDEPARRTFFGPAVKNIRFVIVDSGDTLAENHPWNSNGQDKDGEYKPLRPFPQPVLALELRGTMEMKGDNPWILGELLAFLPADGKTPLDHLGWTSALVTEPVVVPAGTFRRVFHCRRPRGDGQYAQRHTMETWFAEGVGLIKLVAADSTGTPIYTLQLLTHK